mmetsp:Transcript_12249/g.17651  ORF Transcript_12249/g.17651 Transcript_12249/m.17651 type:complete len:95 (+) Transcript_12249:131-415(+)|eukprot:CAMPEP_0172415042 /NCGR_PEP_ID=MMETSP1064-20121228/1591_1 /TAXON_ID=202472 /ORGANISM="Aulacoseira subarctica , Strain CCAP 1002/5" /LENGTH=94 /DNA_ID=CAMNT_0013151939 /DNA_START=128 /DNA_END=412 /DNA_ORIENTATION=+
MVYIGADGRVVKKRSPWRLSIVTDFLSSIFQLILVFFQSMTAPRDRYRTLGEQRRTYAERQGVRRPGENTGANRANVRQLRNLGDASAPCGGGG